VNTVLIVQFSLLSLFRGPETIHLSFNLLSVDDWNSVCLSVWFSCLYSVQCSACFLSVSRTEFVVLRLCRSLLCFMLSDSWSRASLATFGSDNASTSQACANAIASLNRNVTCAHQLWVRVVSVSSVSVRIPLTITFNLIMITILLVRRPSPVC